MKRISAFALSFFVLANLSFADIGSADDVWKKFSDNRKEIYVQKNAVFFGKPKYTGAGFHTYVVTNLPKSNIVGAPQSVMSDVEANCEDRTYHLLGALFFEGKNRSGIAMNSTPAENIYRKIVPSSAFEKAFEELCQIAKSENAH